VYVTGTFDDWGKTVKLEKKGDVYEKEVQLLKSDEKVYYKVRWNVIWFVEIWGKKTLLVTHTSHVPAHCHDSPPVALDSRDHVLMRRANDQ
jgi:hypothetical protein